MLPRQPAPAASSAQPRRQAIFPARLARLTYQRAARLCQAALLAQGETVATRHWTVRTPRPAGAPVVPAPCSPRERLLLDRWWESGAGGQTYRLFDAAGRPRCCPVCGSADRWTPVGAPEHQTADAFRCEHGLPPGAGVPATLVMLSAVAACRLAGDGAEPAR